MIGRADCVPAALAELGIISKFLLLVSAPLGVVTTTGPVVAPLGTTAVVNVLLTTLKLVAGTPLKVTAVVPVSPWPRICAV
ncbi:MAG: hypothetical protein WBD59_19085, partial [Candidatus Sulfotelmatobacter sp.]